MHEDVVYTAMPDGLLINITISYDGKINAYLFSADYPDNRIRWEAKASKIRCTSTSFVNRPYDSIYLNDLTGNGWNSPLNNKGFGSILVSSAMNVVKHHYGSKLSSNATISGIMSAAGDCHDMELHHQRRTRFWEKMGLAVIKGKNDHFRLEGSLPDFAMPSIPFEDFHVKSIESGAISEIKTANKALQFSCWTQRDEAALYEVLSLKYDYKTEAANIANELDTNNRISGFNTIAQKTVFVFVVALSILAIYLLGLAPLQVLCVAIPLYFFLGYQASSLAHHRVDGQLKTIYRQKEEHMDNTRPLMENISRIDQLRFGLLTRAAMENRLEVNHFLQHKFNSHQLFKHMRFNTQELGILLKQSRREIS